MCRKTKGRTCRCADRRGRRPGPRPTPPVRHTVLEQAGEHVLVLVLVLPIEDAYLTLTIKGSEAALQER